MRKNMIKIIVNSIIKWILLLNVCKSVVTVSHADPKFDDIYARMCSVLKLTRFCLPYMMGSYPYPYYALPPAVPVAPFPLIVNPTTPSPPFTIPTIFTTIHPSGPNGIGLPPLPGGFVCPPSPTICPPAALSLPYIDQRQGL